jgi:DNA repair protein RadA/Sms
MTRGKTQYRCRDCGSVAPRWAGRCAPCGEWNTLEEEVLTTGRSHTPKASGGQGPVELGQVVGTRLQARTTGLAELDRVLGGGLVASSLTLLAGEPGIGKSTLLLQMLAAMATQGLRTVLVAAEESPEQVGMRAARLGIGDPAVWVSGDRDLAAIRAVMSELRPDVLVVDSIQTISDAETGPPGSVSSVRACASALAEDAKSGGPAVVLAGHVTKDGAIAGPRVLEHLVDTVLCFEGDRHHALRTVRAVKHRFGAVGELGIWEMTESGLREVPDGGAFLLADRRPGTPGSVVFPAMEGRRPLLTEIQALVAPPGPRPPRRSASGLEGGRLSQLLAVLHRRAGAELERHDVYVSAVGGLRVVDPGADLAVATAITSAATARLVPAHMVALGEVGLGGELRQVAQTPRRLAEAARHGFAEAVVPPGVGSVPGIQTVEASTLSEALDVLLPGRPEKRPKLRVLSGAGDRGLDYLHAGPSRPEARDEPWEAVGAGQFDDF